MAPTHDLVSFDLDGTLVDTAAEIAEAANRTLATHGFARRPVAEIVLLVGNGLRALMEQLLARAAAEQPARAGGLHTAEVFATLDRHYAETVGTLAVAYPGCAAALAQLQDAGVRLACTTNKEHRHALHVLEASGLGGCFDLVVGGDTLPEKKPHPSVLHHVARRLHVPIDRVAHVGDSRVDVAAARNAGCAAWAVPWGYNAGVPIAQSRPDRVFDSLPAVAAHVLAPLRAAGVAP